MAGKRLAKSNGRPPKRHEGKWREPFIAGIRDTGIVLRACLIASVSRATVYRARQSDPAFLALWDDAFEDAIDLVEATVRDRALNGTTKIKVVQEVRTNEAGEETLVTTRREAITEYSDTLLLALLNGRRASVFSRHATVAVETGEVKVYVSFPMGDI